jgi:hypothetical protein
MHLARLAVFELPVSARLAAVIHVNQALTAFD